jgi:cytidylate kinase
VDLSHVVWIGGPEGSGTSPLAAALAERFGWRLYHLDEHTQAHEARMPQSESFVTYSRHRMRLVLEDLRELPDERACVVEGPQLFPTSVSAVLREPDQALFLIPQRDEPIAQTIAREARDLRLPVLPVDRPLDELIELAAAQLAPVADRLSGATGTSP